MEKTTILCGWANPQDRQLNILPLSLARESQIILDLHELHSDKIDVKMITELTPERLVEKIKTNKPKILCISGHTVPKVARGMFMPSEAFLEDKTWQKDHSFQPSKLSTNELTEFLNKCNTDSCKLDRSYKCHMSNTCYKEIYNNKIFLKTKEEPRTIYSTQIPFGEYSDGFCFEDGTGKLLAVRPEKLAEMIKSAYGTEKPDVVFLNMCASHTIGKVLYEQFDQKIHVICWSTLAADQASIVFFEKIMNGIVKGEKNIETLFEESRDELKTIFNIGHPKNNDRLTGTFFHGMPFHFQPGEISSSTSQTPQHSRKNPQEDQKAHSAPLAEKHNSNYSPSEKVEKVQKKLYF